MDIGEDISPYGRKPSVKSVPKRRKSTAPAGKRKPGMAVKTTGIDDLKAVETIIRKNPKGMTTAGLVKKSGLNIARIRYLISQLRKKKRIETPERGRYVGVKPLRGKSGLSEMERVMDIIRQSRKGVTPAILVEKSGLVIDRIRYLIARLKAKGKIEAISRGVYKKA